MEQGYLKRSWDALKSDKGWWKPVFVLTLVQLIPIVGQIFVLGYLFQWAREAAWGVEKPLSHKVDDFGKLFKTGGIVFIVTLAWSFVVSIAYSIIVEIPVLGWILAIPLFVALLAACVVIYVAALRAAIYDSLEAGFQVKHAWELAKRDPKGLLRVFGVSLLPVAVAFVFGFFIAILGLIFVFPILMTGTSDAGIIVALFAVLPIVLILLLAISLLYMFASTILTALMARALGYWMAQFKPGTWGSYKDPLPTWDVAPASDQAPTVTPASATPATVYEPAPAEETVVSQKDDGADDVK